MTHLSFLTGEPSQKPYGKAELTARLNKHRKQFPYFLLGFLGLLALVGGIIPLALNRQFDTVVLYDSVILNTTGSFQVNRVEFSTAILPAIAAIVQGVSWLFYAVVSAVGTGELGDLFTKNRLYSLYPWRWYTHFAVFALLFADTAMKVGIVQRVAVAAFAVLGSFALTAAQVEHESDVQVGSASWRLNIFISTFTWAILLTLFIVQACITPTAKTAYLVQAIVVFAAYLIFVHAYRLYAAVRSKYTSRDRGVGWDYAYVFGVAGILCYCIIAGRIA